MFRTIITTLTLATIFTTQLSAKNIDFRDDFNHENKAIGQLNFNKFTHWNVTEGYVDLKGNGFYDFYPNNGLYLDLDGSGWLAGKLESKQFFQFYKGDKIHLSFDIIGENIQTGFDNNLFTFSLGGFNQVYTPANIGTNSLQLDVDYDFLAPLLFSHQGGDNGGLILDNIKLSSVSLNKPEPVDIPEGDFLFFYFLFLLFYFGNFLLSHKI